MTYKKARKMLDRAEVQLISAKEELRRAQAAMLKWHRNEDDADDDDAFELVVKIERARANIEGAQETLASADWVE